MARWAIRRVKAMPTWLTLSEGADADTAEPVVATADREVIRGVLALIARRLGLRPARRSGRTHAVVPLRDEEEASV